jgi:hypothetical protein
MKQTPTWGDCQMSGEADRPFYSPHVQSPMQSLLATLADIDFAYEHERAKLSQSRTQASLKVCLLAQLERRHREQREPYVRQLALLQDQHCPREVLVA